MGSRGDIPDNINALKAALIGKISPGYARGGRTCGCPSKASDDQALIAHQQLQIKKLTRILNGRLG